MGSKQNTLTSAQTVQTEEPISAGALEILAEFHSRKLKEVHVQFCHVSGGNRFDLPGTAVIKDIAAGDEKSQSFGEKSWAESSGSHYTDWLAAAVGGETTNEGVSEASTWSALQALFSEMAGVIA